MWEECVVGGQVELFVAYAGSGDLPWLLVIHGGPDWDHSYLREPLAKMIGTHRLLLPDLRGCGRSARGLPLVNYHPDAVVDDLLTILDSFDGATADVLGFSYGGLLAQRLAITAPLRIRRMIIASSSVLPVPADSYQNWPERALACAPEREVWASPSAPEAERTRAAAFAGARANIWRSEALPEYRRRVGAVRFSADWDRARRAGALPSARIDNPLRRLSETGIPTLLLHGRYDMAFPATLAEQTAGLLPNAEAVVLDNAGHMAHIDQPDR
ncbi:alpha/beta hydrolase [Nocardia uniformis]|uniref:Alpha/beta hydrolase n=2 Tax=Nocardia uniformis TaxID=53432 RepID=A0A849BTX4_9NOCA|nr:alpha/beta hydrolase [Nocardia uniformis]NNH68306.1 alpha/beta hydrolase [Nocardia uniformis]